MYDRLANEDFERARLKAFWRKLSNWFTGERNQLLPFEKIRAMIPKRGQHDMGLTQVPIEQIIGSEGRYMDFDRAFLPIQTHTRDRWINIDKAHYEDIILPPVDLYKIGEIYFVKDGNHRVSVARLRGQQYVDAHVVEIGVPGFVRSEQDLDELVLVHERQEFIEATQIDQLVPTFNIETSIHGQYQRLLDHINAHRWYMGERRTSEVNFDEAVKSWYENFYAPVIELIEQKQLLTSFPDVSAADLYLWIMETQWRLRQAQSDRLVEADREPIQRLLSEQSEHPERKLVAILLQTGFLAELAARMDHARFMEQTQIANSRPAANLSMTLSGGYDRLLEHINAHRWYMGEHRSAEIPYAEAVLSWYDHVYLPLVDIIREQDILVLFPGRTETDLYLWILQRQWLMREMQGTEVALEDAVENFTDENVSPAIKLLKSLRSGTEESPDEETGADERPVT